MHAIWQGAKKKANCVQIFGGKMQKNTSIMRKTLDYAEISTVNKIDIKT